MKFSFERNNFNALVAVGALGGVGGSVLTVLLAASAIWALASLVLRRFAFVITRSDLGFLLPACLFVAVQILFGLINFDPATDNIAFTTGKFGSLALLLVGWFMIPRLRLSGYNLLDALFLGSAFCGLLVLPVALYQALVLGMRAEGGAGNALPFALICSVFSILSLFNLLVATKWRFWLGLAGFAAGLASLMLSGSIGLLPVAFGAALVFAIVHRRIFAGIDKRLFVVAGLAGLVGIGLAASKFFGRIVNAFRFLTEDHALKDFTTFNERIDMWTAAVKLIAEHPLRGYGIENREALVTETTGLLYKHFHSGYLTVLVDSGVLGLIAMLLLAVSPLYVALKAKSDEAYGTRLFVAAFLVAIYLFGGLTNYVFMHDIYDSVFMWIAICIAASVPVSVENPVLFGRHHS